LKGKVYLLTTIDERWDWNVNKENKQILSEHSKVLADLKNNENLINVRGHPNAHFKLWLFNDEVAILSSANLRTTSLGANLKNRTHEKNEYLENQPPGIPEAGIKIVENKEDLAVLKSFFQFIWANSFPITRRKGYEPKTDYKEITNLSGKNVGIRITLEEEINENLKKINNKNTFAEKLEEKLKELNDYNTIQVTGYSLSTESLEGDEFLKKLNEDLNKKREQGKKVKIKIVVKKFDKTAGKTKKELKRYFEDHEIEVRRHKEIHGKTILFKKDGNPLFGAIFTGEFFPKEHSGINIGYCTENYNILKDIDYFFKNTWKEANEKLDFNKKKENDKLEIYFREQIKIFIFDEECVVEKSEYTISLRKDLKKKLKKDFFECWILSEEEIFLLNNKQNIILKLKKISEEEFILAEVCIKFKTHQNEDFEKFLKKIKEGDRVKPPKYIVFKTTN